MVGVTPLKVNVTEEIDFDNFSLKLNISNPRVYAMSPLHEMLWQENYDGAESYIQQQIESGDIGDVLRQYDRDGRSVLMYAIVCRNIKLAKMLIEAKAPVNYKTEEVGQSPPPPRLPEHFPHSNAVGPICTLLRRVLQLQRNRRHAH